MTTLNSLHIDIAKVLMQCAKENKTITYGELCKEVGYNSQELWELYSTL